MKSFLAEARRKQKQEAAGNVSPERWQNLACLKTFGVYDLANLRR
jgi:hypothetical protein